MSKFFSTERYLQMYYILGHPKFSQRQMARDLNMKHGGKISLFVNRLEELNLVARTHEISRKKPSYQLTSRDALLNFFSRFRNMKKEEIETYRLGIDRMETLQFLSDNGGIMCLTTALDFYDKYFRDESIHVYVNDPKLLGKVYSQVEGRLKVTFYNFDLPDEPVIKDGIKITSPTRTIIDLYCNNMSYAAEPFMKKAWV
jgi:hypothetical protein